MLTQVTHLEATGVGPAARLIPCLFVRNVLMQALTRAVGEGETWAAAGLHEHPCTPGDMSHRHPEGSVTDVSFPWTIKDL